LFDPLAFWGCGAYITCMYNYISVTADEAATPARVRDGTIKLHDESGFAGMRKAGRLSAEILDALVPFIQPGVTTGAIDDLVREMMLARSGLSSGIPWHTTWLMLVQQLCVKPR